MQVDGSFHKMVETQAGQGMLLSCLAHQGGGLGGMGFPTHSWDERHPNGMWESLAPSECHPRTQHTPHQPQ